MKNTNRSLRSRLRRRLRCVLIALVLPALMALGPGPAAAQSPSDHWFQWGPSHSPSIGSPLANPNMLSALYLAVDENGVSQQALGKPSLVMETEDASYPQEFYEETESYPDKARAILDEDGITTLALTIAPDPSVPEAPALARAVADELRTNLGAQVTVVEGDADLLVTRSLGKSPSAAPGAISLETSCTPNTVRPNEWTVVECDSTVKNSGQADLIYNLVLIQDDPGPGAIDYPIVSGERNGKSEIVRGSYAAAGQLAAGETAVHRRLILLQGSGEGTYDLTSRVIVAGDTPAEMPVRFTVSSQASPPPSDLEVTRQLTKRWTADGYEYASFETKITNRGSQPATDLKVTDRNDNSAAYAIERQPPPDYRDEGGQLVSWRSLQETLAPGASMALQTVFRSTQKGPFLSINAAGMVEAKVGGAVERYAAPVMQVEELSGGCGGCGDAGSEASAATGASSFGSQGDGTSGSSSRLAWPAVSLAIAGMALTGVGFALRKGRSPGLFVSLALASLLLPTAVAHAQAPTPPVSPGSVSLDVTCSPDMFRPDTWTVLTCTTRVTNMGENGIPSGTLSVMSDSGPIPEYYWVSNVHDGKYVPVGPFDLSFDVGPLQPGETFEFTLTGLDRMTEGTWNGSDSLMIGDEEVTRIPLKLVAYGNATVPLDHLDVSTTLANESPDGVTPLSSAEYETVIENRGQTPVTSLTMTERADDLDLVDVDPKPSSRNDDVRLMTWDLASFGKESLAQGETVVLHTTYRPADASVCTGGNTDLVVEADVGGTTERYGARPDSAPLGDCSFEEGVPGGRGGPVGFGQGGEGPAEATFDFIWAAALLATAGAALVAVALVARRRLRS